VKLLHAARFVLELCLAAALVVAGAQIAWWTGILLPLTAVVVWGRFVAPRSPKRLADPGRLMAELAVFSVTCVALVATGHPIIATTMTATSVAVALAVRIDHT